MPVGRTLILAGVALVALGLLVSYTRLGRLPGDIFASGKNYSFYFPVTTCIVISVFLTLILWVFRR